MQVHRLSKQCEAVLEVHTLEGGGFCQILDARRLQAAPKPLNASAQLLFHKGRDTINCRFPVLGPGFSSYQIHKSRSSAEIPVIWVVWSVG